MCTKMQVLLVKPRAERLVGTKCERIVFEMNTLSGANPPPHTPTNTMTLTNLFPLAMPKSQKQGS